MCVALMAAPNAFATLARTEAGAYVGRLFWMDARVSMLLGVLLLGRITDRMGRKAALTVTVTIVAVASSSRLTARGTGGCDGSCGSASGIRR